MGKYMDAYKNLVRQRDAKRHMYESTMNQYNHLMTDNAREWNRVHHQLSEDMYARELEIALTKAIEEMKQEAIDKALNSVQVEVQNNATKQLQDLEKQIRNLFS